MIDLEKKKEVQEYLVSQFLLHNKIYFGVATGVGKTKVALDCIQHFPNDNWYLGVGNIKDIDSWEKEIIYWKYNNMFKGMYHYNSFSKLPPDNFSIVLDEAHHLTDNNIEFLMKADKIIVLTATMGDKFYMLHKLGVDKSVTISLDKAVELKLVSDYRIKAIRIDLDNKKNYRIETKARNFYTSEEANYKYLHKEFLKNRIYANNEKMKYQYYRAVANRKNFLYSAPSKIEATQLLLDVFSDYRKIVFCGSINVAEELCGDNVYHSKTTNDYYNQFINDKYLKTLGVVDAVDESANIPYLKLGIVQQIKNVDRRIIQRLGRLLRGSDTGYIIILYYGGTQDQNWFENATKDFNENKIEHILWQEVQKNPMMLIT